MKFHDIAKRLRSELGITQRAMAKRLGITAVHLCNIERGTAMPSYYMMDRFGEVCGVKLFIGVLRKRK